MWGLPGVWVLGWQAVILAFLVGAPVYLAARISRQAISGGSRHPMPPALLVLWLGVLYLTLDAVLGRRRLEASGFFEDDAVTRVVEEINEEVSHGRGPLELIGGVAAFVPFAMLDLCSGRRAVVKLGLATTSLGYIIYEAGISRGFLLAASASILAGSRWSWQRVVLAAAVGAVLLVIMSYARGDVSTVDLVAPWLGAVVYPYLNLSSLAQALREQGSVVDFAWEFFKKFVPGFVVAKQVFSFNYEMTQVIYPEFGTYVPAVSVFTYLGEMLYYQPAIGTAVLAGTVLAALTFLAQWFLERSRLRHVQVYAGVMSVVLLRSRIQDVYSFQMLLIVFLAGWMLGSALAGRRAVVRGKILALERE